MIKSLKPSEFEPKILRFWQEKKIFEKTLKKESPRGDFVFYDGPPFATGLPHYGHILASTIKDLIPRYKTMQGYFVRRRWGWDCHGLPIEEIVERQLGISGKKQIEEIGIKKFNETCHSKVLEYADEWGKTIKRIARWIDFENSYKTMDRDYMESVWWAFKQIYEKGLVYEGRKVLLYCPRCETPVSNFEVAMDNSYKDVEEDTVTVKFRIKSKESEWQNTYFLAWTTTPWTLPGNAALAINKDLIYNIAELNGERFIVAEASPEGKKLNSIKKISGKDLIGLEYEPLFDVEAIKSDKTFKVYPADFVLTEEGTGIVHTAVVYGEEDYELGQKFGLPVVPLLDEKGKFNNEAPEFLRSIYFKDANKMVISDLEKRGLLFQKQKQTHSYPFCWRCANPLYYNAIPAWFINIQKIKSGLIKSNGKEINWYPEHLKHGRYEKSVESAPDWNISRNRYWGNPIPIWKCENGCPPIIIGSIKDLGLTSNTFYFSRHAQARQNVLGIESSYPEKEIYDLTEIGLEQTKKLIEQLKNKGGVDLIFASDLLRTKHTAEIIGKELNAPVAFDERLREYNLGELNGRPANDYDNAFMEDSAKWTKAPKGGETWTQIQNRMIDFVNETNHKYKNKKILIISHGDPLWLVQKYFGSEREYPNFAELFEISVGINDLHRPYIDEVILKCPKCGSKAKRIKEIFDSWTEAGSMPFAEYHYPFDNKEIFEKRLPAQFVAEYIAQTRAWFYVMHVISYILFAKAPFKNVATTGTILAEDDSKMSKSKNNFPDPSYVIEKYGADALRFYLMNSVVMQAENLNFNVKDLEVVYRKVITILLNVYNYFAIYADEAGWKFNGEKSDDKEISILDKWIISRTQELINLTTESLDNYNTVKTTRLIAEFIEDLSTWYLRRSRNRKDKAFFSTMYKTLIKTGQIIAPIMPYLAEFLYLNLNEKFGDGKHQESIHLTDWPEKNKKLIDKELIEEMIEIRRLASIALAKRAELGIRIRQPLASLKIKNRISKIKNNEELLKILADEINVREIIFDSEIKEEIELDTEITPELREQGILRDFIRLVQGLRQKAGYQPKDKIYLFIETADNLGKILNRHLDEFKKEVGAKNIEFQRTENFDVEDESQIDGQKIWAGIKKI